MTFRKGDRVKASKVWLARSMNARTPRRTRGGKFYDPARLGTVIHNPKGECVTVHWDGNAPSSVSQMHNTFLTKMFEPEKITDG